MIVEILKTCVENYTKCCVCDDIYVKGDVKVRDH